MEPKIETNALQDHRINSKLNQIPQNEFKGKEIKKDVWDIRTCKRVLGGTYLLVHVFGIIGFIQLCQGEVLTSTIVFALILGELALFSVTIGCHRLFAHRTFKATTPLKIFLTVCNCFSGQNTIWMWCAWHRVHHKCVDTDEDPHNSTRGFFYSHIGWLVMYDRQKLLQSLDKIDMSDLDQEPIVMFQKRHAVLMHVLCVFTLPTVVPWYFFGESLFTAFCVATCLRNAWISHRTFLINSVAHMWGDRPYDTSIRPVESRIVSIFALGEGWHNYHHVFPWDYKASELGLYRWNFSTAIIEFFAWVGLAYDLKTVSKETVMKRVARTGDPHHFKSGPWGWGDKSIPKENVEQTLTLYPAKET